MPTGGWRYAERAWIGKGHTPKSRPSRRWPRRLTLQSLLPLEGGCGHGFWWWLVAAGFTEMGGPVRPRVGAPSGTPSACGLSDQRSALSWDTVHISFGYAVRASLGISYTIPLPDAGPRKRLVCSIASCFRLFTRAPNRFTIQTQVLLAVPLALRAHRLQALRADDRSSR